MCVCVFRSVAGGISAGAHRLGNTHTHLGTYGHTQTQICTCTLTQLHASYILKDTQLNCHMHTYTALCCKQKMRGEREKIPPPPSVVMNTFQRHAGVDAITYCCPQSAIEPPHTHTNTHRLWWEGEWSLWSRLSG